MNGPLKMYRLKPIVQPDMKVELPDCMYKLRNIHASKNGMVVEQRSADHIVESKKNLDISEQNNLTIPEMAALEARQEQILQQLAELKKQMNNIRSQLKITESTSSCTIISTTPSQAQLPVDIIINASPTFPPYSLKILQKLWQGSINIIVKTFLHSSVASLTEKAAELSKNLEEFTHKVTNNVNKKLNIRLIWKDVGANTELIVSPLHTPILGEVNILRYLARLNSAQLSYENVANPEEIENLLDTSYLIVRSRTKTERAKLLQILSKSLDKGQFLADRTSVSVADLAAFSALTQVASANEINVKLSKWLERCNC